MDAILHVLQVHNSILSVNLAEAEVTIQRHEITIEQQSDQLDELSQSYTEALNQARLQAQQAGKKKPQSVWGDVRTAVGAAGTKMKTQHFLEKWRNEQHSTH